MPAGHLLPGRRAGRVRVRRRSAGRAATVQRRQTRPAGGSGSRALAAEFDGADQVRIGAAIHSVRAVPDDQLAEVLRVGRRPAAARARVRAAGRERGLPGGLRPYPDPAAGRARLRRPAAHRGARHPPERGRHRLVRQFADHVSFCPTTERDLADGIGPAVRAGRGRRPADPGQRPERDGRPARRGSGAGAGRPAGQPAPRPVQPGGAGGFADRRRPGQPGLGPMPAGSRWASGPTWWRSGWTPSGPPGCCPVRRSWRPARPTCDTVLVDGRPVVSGGRHRLGDVGALLAEAIAPLWA